MVHIPANVTQGTSSKLRTGPAPEAGIAGIPLSNKEAEYFPELHHEKSLITQNTHRTMNLPLPPNFESEPSVRLPYEVSRYNVLRHKDSAYQDYESSYTAYTDTSKHTRHSDLGQPLTPVAEVGTGGGDSEDKRVLAATFSARAYYSNQPPKLELSPALKTTTTSSNPTTNPVVEEESTTGEAPDIDAIARDVYSKLKRRLATERERVRGLA